MSRWLTTTGMQFDARRNITKIWNLPGFPSFIKNLSMVGTDEPGPGRSGSSGRNDVRARSLELGDPFIVSWKGIRTVDLIQKYTWQPSESSPN